jgi:hypothetical protein
MAKHDPFKVWMLRPVGQYPNGSVQTENKHEISVMYQAGELQYESGFICTRRDARLLVKRILECLEATK